MKNFYSKTKINLKKNQKGMTLIELLVVVAIITILTGITLFDHNSFRSAISTENLANDIALSIRKAQSHAIGVRGIGVNFDLPQGVHFSTEVNPAKTFNGSNKAFILFIDFDNPKKYDNTQDTCGSPLETSECQERFTISSRDKILGFYLPGDIDYREGILNILFSRPNPDASFCYYEEEGDSCTSNISSVKIAISNGLSQPKEIIRYVTVWNTGQISVTKN